MAQSLGHPVSVTFKVGGHYPVWTGCAHAPTPVLVAKLKPRLEKYHATGYMRGPGAPQAGGRGFLFFWTPRASTALPPHGPAVCNLAAT
jgi:hypothetical protein